MAVTTGSCIVCQTAQCKRDDGKGDFARFDCPRCGSFVLAGTADTVLPEKLDEVPVRRSIMSHTLRRMQRPGDTHLRIIASNELPSFWSDTLPNPQQQADNLIRWIGDNEVPDAWTHRILPDGPVPFDNRGKKLQKLLRLHGFTLKRQGEHEVWAKPGSPPVPVPRTKHVPDGTAECILKKIDVSYRVRNFNEIMRSAEAG
jgi:hypothetical protein